MVLPASRRISRVLRYSGTGCVLDRSVYGAVTLFGWAFLPYSTTVSQSLLPARNPKDVSLVWPLSPSLAATKEIDVSFSSSGYLDVSVPRVPSSQTIWIFHLWVTRHYPRWVPPFGYLRIAACLRLPAAFRSLPRPSSAIGAMASTLCSF